MQRDNVFFDFDDAWIVHRDDAVVVIDKPEGIPTQSADPERPDDLVTRFKRHLAATAMRRGGEPGAYVGTHQRLDRDTSGVILFTRDRSVNPAIAEQFEGRRVKKTYLAAVSGWTKRGVVTLDDWLATGDGGRMEVVTAGRRGAQRARTHVKLLECAGDRALLELELETGRTHQARIQLAHARASIAGDVLYGGAPAPRLMLHASSLELRHPKTGKQLLASAPVPLDLREWLVHGDRDVAIFDDDEAVRRALRRALVRRYGLARATGARETTAFRLVNEAGDGLPRLAVDVYGEHLVAQLYGTDGPWADRARRERVLDRLAELGFEGIYLKIRPKQASTVADPKRDDIAPSAPVRGTAALEEFSVLEEGVGYLVRLGDGLSTGIFLDQRANRTRVRELAKGKTLLNLFAYTCGFSVAAAAGGARRTVSVDVSSLVLDRGRAGFLALGLDVQQHAFVTDDTFGHLAKVKHKKERFDVVVLDPPSYSTTKSGRFVADTDYVELAAQAASVVAPGGRLLACTNHRGIGRDRFRRILFDALRKAGRNAKQIKDLPDPSDFPIAPGAESHLKSALVTFEL